MDDILIYSKNVEAYKQHLKQIFEFFREHKSYAKLSKHVFFTSRIEIFGYVISYEGILVDLKKMSR